MSDLTNRYANSETSEFSLEQLVGKPQASAAGIGSVVMSFNHLRLAIWKAFEKIQVAAPFVRDVEAGTFQFRERVELLSFVVRHFSHVIHFNVGTDDAFECWKIIAGQCLRAEELWAEVMLFDGSELTWDPLEGTEHLLPIRPRNWDGARLVGIADFITTASTYVDEFFLVMDVRAPANGRSRSRRMCTSQSIRNGRPLARSGGGTRRRQRRR
jgi:hypothetical protein